MNDTEFSLLALEIQQDHPGMDIDAAWRLAWQQMPDLLNDVMMDVRFRPARVVMFEPLTARELMEMTERE